MQTNKVKINYPKNGKWTSATVSIHVADFWAGVRGIDGDWIDDLRQFVKDEAAKEPIQGSIDLERRLLADTRRL